MNSVVSLDFFNLNNKRFLGGLLLFFVVFFLGGGCFEGWGGVLLLWFWGFFAIHAGMKVHVASKERMNNQRKHLTDNIYIHI